MTTERIHRRVCVAVLGAACGLALPCAAELVYYLPFDNGSTATLTNYGSVGGTGTAVTVSGATPAPSTDMYTNLWGSHSEYFPMTANGQQGGRIDLPNSTNQLRLTTSGDEMTIVLWLKWKGPDSRSDMATQGIVSTLPGSLNTGWAFTIYSSGALGVNIAGGGRNTTVAITSNEWTHIAMTWKSQNPWGDTLKFYINGQIAADNLGGFGPASAIANTETIRLGNLPGTWFPVNGTMDDVGLYDKRLTSGKIRALYTAPGVVKGLNLGIMNQLFTLYDAATGTTTITLGGKQKTWRYATGLTGHAAGDTWTDGTGAVYIQLDAANTGVKYVPSGTAMCLY